MDFLSNQLPEEQILLSDENGEEMAFHFLDLILYREQEYMVLMPAEGPYQGEAVILRRERGAAPGEESYADVEDPATLKAVYGIFKEHFQDRVLFED